VSDFLSVVVPVYNERDGLPEFYARLVRTLEALDVDHELLFIDDGSDDGSSEWLAALRERDERAALLRLSRNFGKEAAMSPPASTTPAAMRWWSSMPTGRIRRN
jgi:glycosyltransferase involved in cell wall biosynthesis